MACHCFAVRGETDTGSGSFAESTEVQTCLGESVPVAYTDATGSVGTCAEGSGAVVSARREQILDAARDLIVRDGFATASMHAIARAAGVTRPALYGEFGDRDQLFAALLDREENKVMELVEESMPEFPRDADPLEYASALADFYLDLVQSAPQSFQFVLMPPEGAPPGTSERVERGKAAIRDRGRMLIAMVAAAQDREVDAELLSHAALAVSETAARLVLDPGQAGDRDEVARTLRWMARRVVGGPTTGTFGGPTTGTVGGPVARTDGGAIAGNRA